MSITVRIHEQLSRWLQRSYIVHQPEKMLIVMSSSTCTNPSTLGFVAEHFEVGDGYQYAGYE
ncbi:MAG: hypothetical protein ACPG7F_22445, partial [Aggregatilineales bacterium]